MKDVADLAKWLLEADIRAKNATSAFIALFALVLLYALSKNYLWFQEIKAYGPLGPPIALFVAFLMTFLGVWLFWSVVGASYNQLTARRKQEEEAETRRNMIRDNLFSLTDWQRRFLLRFITEDRSQIPEFEVGQYRAAWDFEMEVLVEKRIVKCHTRAGVYEIEPEYLEYLKEHWDVAAGTLS